MDIAILSSATGEMNSESYRKYVFPSLKKYAEKYSFDLLHYDEKLDSLNRSPHWQKILLMKKHLHNYDWLVWIDADVMVMNHRINIKNYFPENHKMLAYELFDSDTKNDFNSGLFFLKGKNDWSNTYLDQVYHGDHFYSKNPDAHYFDQSAMVFVMNKHDYYDEVKVASPTLHKLWPHSGLDLEDFLLDNTYKNVRDFRSRFNENKYFTIGDFCAHVWFRDMKERSKAYKKLYQHIIWN